MSTISLFSFFFFNDTATTEIYTLSLHDALPISFAATAVQMLQHHLAEQAPPTAIVCSNDLLAIRTIRAASLAGFSVPADISVVGFDGIAMRSEERRVGKECRSRWSPYH